MKKEKDWIRRSTVNLFVAAILAVVLSGCGEEGSTGQITIGASANNPNLFAQSSPSLFDSMWAFAFGREAFAQVGTCALSVMAANPDGGSNIDICITDAFADLRKVDLNPFDDGLLDVTLGRDVATVDLLGSGKLKDLGLIGTFPVPVGVYKEIRFKIDGTRGRSLSADLPGDRSIFIKGTVNSAGTPVVFEFSTELSERLDLLIPKKLIIGEKQMVQYTFFFNLKDVFSLPNIASRLLALAHGPLPEGKIVLEKNSSGDEQMLQGLIKDALDDRIDLNTDRGLSIGTFTPCLDPCV